MSARVGGYVVLRCHIYLGQMKLPSIRRCIMQEVNSVRVVIIIRILWSTFSQRHCTRGGEVQLKRMADIIMSKGECCWLNIIISVYVVRTTDRKFDYSDQDESNEEYSLR